MTFCFTIFLVLYLYALTRCSSSTIIFRLALSGRKHLFAQLTRRHEAGNQVAGQSTFIYGREIFAANPPPPARCSAVPRIGVLSLREQRYYMIDGIAAAQSACPAQMRRAAPIHTHYATVRRRRRHHRF